MTTYPQRIIFGLFMIIFPLHQAFADTAMEKKKDHSLKQVELQWNICDDPVKVLKVLQFQEQKQSQREVFFYDTEALELLDQDVVIRFRKSQQKNGELKLERTIKFRNIEIKRIPWKVLDQADSKCEWDIHVNLERLSCSMTNEIADLNQPLGELELEFLQERVSISSLPKQWGPAQNLSRKGIFRFLGENENAKGKNSEEKGEWSQYQISSARNLISFFELSIQSNLNDFEKTKQKVNRLLKAEKVQLCADQAGITEPLLERLSGRTK